MRLTITVALLLSIVEMIAIIIISPMMKPSIILSFLPEDVRLAAKDHPEPPKSKQMIANLIFILFILAMIGAMIYLGLDGIHRGYDFWHLTFRFMIMLYINKAFDIIVQDQLLVMTLGFYKKVFPETVNCAGWSDRSFNNKKQLIRIISYPFLCMITAGIFILIK